MNVYQLLLEKLSNQWEKEISLKRNDFLVMKGTLNTDLYLVEEGSLRVFIEDENEEHTIRFGYQNSLITALDSFLKEKPTIFYIQAIKKCKIKVLTKNRYVSFLENNDAYKVLWQKMLEDFVHQQIEREVDLITYSPQKRFDRVFERSPHLFQEIPQKYIASYLRMTPETLSRILKKS